MPDGTILYLLPLESRNFTPGSVLILIFRLEVLMPQMQLQFRIYIYLCKAEDFYLSQPIMFFYSLL